jgi:hypothetical protein
MQVGWLRLELYDEFGECEVGAEKWVDSLGQRESDRTNGKGWGARKHDLSSHDWDWSSL